MLGLIPWKITLIAKIPVFRTKSGHFRDSLWLKRSHFMCYIKSDSFFFFFFQEGTLPPCFEQGNTKICPFSYAKIGDTVFDWTSEGNGFGPNTYNGCSFNSQQSPVGTYNMKVNQSLGNTTSPMLFEMGSDSSGVKCQLELTFDCWQDWPTARDNRQVTF